MSQGRERGGREEGDLEFAISITWRAPRILANEKEISPTDSSLTLTTVSCSLLSLWRELFYHAERVKMMTDVDYLSTSPLNSLSSSAPLPSQAPSRSMPHSNFVFCLFFLLFEYCPRFSFYYSHPSGFSLSLSLLFYNRLVAMQITNRGPGKRQQDCNKRVFLSLSLARSRRNRLMVAQQYW